MQNKKKKIENSGYFQQHKNMDTLCLGFYTLAILLAALKEQVSSNQRSFKDGYQCVFY